MNGHHHLTHTQLQILPSLLYCAMCSWALQTFLLFQMLQCQPLSIEDTLPMALGEACLAFLPQWHSLLQLVGRWYTPQEVSPVPSRLLPVDQAALVHLSTGAPAGHVQLRTL
jgi:hypothetical protein